MALDYVQTENDLTECLIKLEMASRALGCDEAVVARLQAGRGLVASRQYNVAVMGEFNRGKSSLINALLGGRILPEAVVPATATVNRVTYGMEESAYAVAQYVDGGSERIPVGELRDYVTKLTRRHEEVSARIREVTVYAPSVICQNHIDLIDTPGLNESERMDDITLGLVGDVDAAIVPLHARSPFSETERDFLVQLVDAPNIRHVLFVVTFMDQLDEEDYDYDDYMAFVRGRILSETEEALGRGADPEGRIARFQAMVGRLEVIGISAKLALDAFATGDRKKLKASRFEEFRAHLVQTLTAQQAENAIMGALEAAEGAIDQMVRAHEARGVEGEEQIAQLADVSPLVERAQEQHLYGGMERMLSLARATIDNRCGALAFVRPRMRKAFIAELSALRQNTHSAIKAALARAEKSTTQLLNEQYAQILQKLPEALEDEFHVLEEAEARCDQALAEEGFEVATDFSQERDRLLRRATWILSKLKFKAGWLKKCTAVTNLALASVNPIELVEADIDALFAWYVTAVQDKERQLVDDWHDMVREGGDLRTEQAQVQADRQAAGLRAALQGEEASWTFYAPELEAIRARCDSIREELAATA